jgi:phenylpropionate dioxygenase-like ring-hydroxylating dioxygenase large terminal subunit
MSIDPKAYWQEEYLEKEYERIFSHSMFVGTSTSLQADGDYTSYRVCGRPFVTRNIAGQLSTFDNVCLHRANLIDPIGQGNRPFRCGYHGWQYGAGGTLVRNPLGTDKCISRRQLQSYFTVENRQLVFVSPRNSLPAGVGEAALEAINFGIGEVFHCESLAHEANWKLLVENVLESYHLSFVHAESFVPTGITSTSKFAEQYHGNDSCFTIASKAGESGKGRIIPGASSDYVHAFIFPNLFISITGGLVGFVSHFKPASAGRTVLEWQLFETPLLVTQKAAVRSYIKKNAIEFTRKVLGEDLVVLNNSQIGTRYARGGHQLQEIEGRIAHFHQTYLQMMS